MGIDTGAAVSVITEKHNKYFYKYKVENAASIFSEAIASSRENTCTYRL